MLNNLRIPGLYLVAHLLFFCGINAQDVASIYQFKGGPNIYLSKEEHPKCSNPSDVRFYRFDEEKVELVWAGPDASVDGTRYLVRYRYSNATEARSWILKWVNIGTYIIINNPLPGFDIEIEIKKICDGSGTNYTLSSDWVSAGKRTLPLNGVRAEEYTAEECSWITAATAERNPNGTYSVVITSDAPDSSNFWRYMLQYRECVADAPLMYEYIMDGDTSILLSPPSHGICEMSVRIIWGGTGGENYEYWCQWINITIDNNNNPPTVTCGQGAAANPTNQNPLGSANVGDTWTVSGIPMVLLSVSGSNGIFSGTANMSFPFGKKSLKVTFSAIGVNTDKEVISGNVLGIQANIDCYKTAPTYGGPGQDICQPKPNKEGWNADGTWGVTGLTHDPYGFSQDGKYTKSPPYNGYKEDDPYDENYDPNGFDSNGNHRETGTKFGPSGCSREGVDSLGKKCDPSNGQGPYHWMSGGGFTESGKEFVEDLGDTLKVYIEEILLELLDQKTIEGSDQASSCDSLRDQMNSKISLLGHDGDIIKGPSGEFFNEGMSKEFKSAPEKVVTDLARRTGQKELEDLHVDLFKCDEKWVRIDLIIDLINSLMETTNLNQLTDDIKEKIKYLPEDIINTFKDDRELFIEWLNSELKKTINEEIPNSYAFEIHPLQGLNHDGKLIPSIYNNDLQNFNYITTNTASVGKSEFVIEDLEKEVNFQLRQGWTNILGKHKALWYEEFAEMSQMSGSEICENDSSNLMPVIIRSNVLGREEKIYIDNISIGPNSGTCDVYYVLYIPTTGQKFVFAAINVVFGSGGLIGDVKLTVVNDFELRVNNSTLMRIFGGSNDTYVSFDCNGLKELSISAELEFCRDYLIPVDPTSKEIDTNPASKVKATFKTKAQGWGQWLIDSLSISPFCVKNAEDIKWSLSHAAFDFSDQASPGFSFPPNYGGEFVNSNGGPTAAWRGVFIKNIEATIPKKFSTGSNPVNVGAYNLIFDGMGFTGSIYAANVLSINEGNIGGWGISIDSMTVNIVKNELLGGAMIGELNVPIFTENLFYSASIYSNNNYQFTISLTDSLTADLWAATVILKENSGVSISQKDNQFVVAAKLNGIINVNGNMGGLALKIPGVKFQDVVVSNISPYFSPGTWSTVGEAGFKFGTFELSAKNIGMYDAPEGKVDLKFTIDISVTDIGDGKAGGETRMYVRGRLEVNGGKQRWVYDNIGIEGVTIDIEFSENKVYGALYFYSNHSSFGTGFKGGILAKFKGLGVIDVFATFGDMPATETTGAYRYFFVDAMATLDKPIPMGALNLYGFGGGIYYNMDRSPVTALMDLNYEGEERAPGDAPSGVVYTPFKSKFGFRAAIALSTSVKEAFNCNVVFGMEFYDGGGIQEVFLEGNARMMEGLEFTQVPSKSMGNKPNSAVVTANMNVNLDFVNKTYDGSLEVFMNVGGVLKGVGTNDKMVDAKIFFGEGTWYIHVGTPSAPCGIQFSIPGIGNIAKSTAYLCIGKQVPDPIPLSERGFPDLKVKHISLAGKDSGTGFAFGSALDLGMNEKTFLIFYGKLKIMMGFDLMIGKYSNAFCSDGGGSEPLGINGWYAQGQAFASVDAALGIKVKVFGKAKQYEIMALKAGVGLAAKLPNPFYATGAIYGEYKIMNGFIKGKCNFKFEIGEACQLADGGTLEQSLAVITDMHPSDQAEALPVNSSARADFFFPIDKDHYESDPNDPSISHKINAKIASIKLTTSDSIEIPFKRSFVDENYSVLVRPTYFLPSNDSITFEVKCSVFVNNQYDTSEIRSIKFKTAQAPDDISLSNIIGSYPFQNMKYFYQKEFTNGKGYISLEYGQPELFQGATNGDIMVKFTSGGSSVQAPCTYNFGANEINFDIPNLNLNSDYLLELIDYRKDKPKGKILCSFSFHTSAYFTFKEKLLAWINNSQVIAKVNYDHILNSQASEPFSDEELNNNWITCYPNLIDNIWYTSIVDGIVYESNYGCTGEPNFRYTQITSPDFNNTIKLAPMKIEWNLPSKSISDCISLNDFFIGQVSNSKIPQFAKEFCREGYDNTITLPNASGTVGVIMTYRLPYKGFHTGIYKVNIKNKTVN